ncbi:MAG TPA: response regulator [Gemmatimonadaceae bacterium]|nr:response regulator [Gemmatimonadaceae bacterium]
MTPCPHTPDPADRPGPPFSFLIVDDSAVMRAMIARTLRLSGLPLADIVEAADGAAGLEALWRAPVDIALVDLNMPIMNGEELIDRLRAEPEFARLPVVVISTEGSVTRIRALEAKGVTFVHKPFTPETLRDTILSVVSYTPDGPLAGHENPDATQLPAGAAPSGGDLDF